MSLGALGDVVFEASAEKVRTWQDMKRSGEARWATHEVFAGKPVKEFIGPGLDTITLQVRLDARLGLVPLDEVKALRRLRDTGAVNQLTLGGELVGDYTVKSLSEDQRRFDPAGVLVTVVVDLTLEEYQ
jgi:hypothetical protein